MNSALQRARATLASLEPEQLDAVLDPEHEALLAALRRRVRGLRHDRAGRAPPRRRRDLDAAARPLAAGHPRASSAGWTGPGHGCAGSKLIPVSVNGTAGFASYKPAGPGRLGAVGHPGDRGEGRPHLRPPQLPLPRALRRARPPAVPRGLTAAHPPAGRRGRTVAAVGQQGRSRGTQHTVVSGQLHLRPAGAHRPLAAAGRRGSSRSRTSSSSTSCRSSRRCASFIGWFAILFTGKLPGGPRPLRGDADPLPDAGDDLQHVPPGGVPALRVPLRGRRPRGLPADAGGHGPGADRPEPRHHVLPAASCSSRTSSCSCFVGIAAGVRGRSSPGSR